MHYIGVLIPVWLTDPQAMHLFSAAEKAGLRIMDIVHPPAAAGACDGVNLCRTPSEYLPCRPQLVMTLDLSRHALTAALLRVEQSYYLQQQRSYSVSHDFGAEKLSEPELVTWINDFARGKRVTKLYMIGPEASNPTFHVAVQNSDLAPVLQGDSVPPERVLALGMARLTKGRMESQDSDCIERPECEKIRDEADRLAGRSTSGNTSARTEL